MSVDIKNIKVIIYDFDGVMTDNKVLVSSDGTESVFCNRSDGLAVSAIKKTGIHQCIISTEENKVVEKRAEKLGLPCIHGVSDKKTTMLDYLKKNNFGLNSVAYVGNDLNDLAAMKLAAIKIAPKDAAKEILVIADIIMKAKGGDGVIYELYKSLIRK
ncbi:MAG: HAD hydrolase family protein [Candidatus Margulisbacteria bacterium]|nr:HAD hydrolase family protein [Candidatus Margulisiibacteriota bacterium]